ncbi:MAG: FAD-dependent oxidoreductase [Thermomicrobiales bacterium]|nr:FAD-dependent oxidoreductase [Thermomicrobiales bacterium]
MLSTAEAVVIGAGSFGSSLAYHLAKMGLPDVVLLDRFEVGAQTSPRAAGLTQQIRRERETTLLAKRSVEKLVAFTEETDIPLELHQSGSVKMARDAAGVAQVEWEIREGQQLGLDIRPIAPDELTERAPWARTEGVRAMWITPSDLFLEPRQIPQVYTAAARAEGATVLTETPVTGLERETGSGRVTGVTTSKGSISAPIVVDAAGAWTRQVAEESGIRIPVVPMRHQLFITEPMPGIRNEQPICRVIDANVYVRPCWGGLMLGGYEANPLPFEMRDASPRFQIADMPLDVQVLRGLARAVRDQFPGLEDAPLQLYRGGLPTMTADGKHIVGAVPGAEGFYTVTGCVVGGLSISPGIGEMLAQLILTGASEIPLDLYSVSRFSPDFNEDELIEACVDAYAHHYSEDYAAIGSTS